MSIRVAVVDDDPFVCGSLKTILDAQPDLEVVATGGSGTEAVELFSAKLPDILLMDIQMAGKDGIAAAKDILATHPDAKIVFLTTFSDDEYIVAALRLGAKGYLIKQDVADIAPALRSVAAGQSVLGGEVVSRVDSLMGTVPDGGEKEGARFCAPNLTERECEIVELVARGLDNREIAGRVFMGEGTVRNHISTILQKLGLKNRTQIAIYYYTSR